MKRGFFFQGVMRRNPSLFKFPAFAILFLAVHISTGANQWQHNGFFPDPHKGAVTGLAMDMNGTIISSGEDGFINIWDTEKNAAVERFQLSSHRIIAMALRPGRPFITIAESDGIGLYRISTWDYILKRNIYTLRFKDPVSYVAYSAGGNFLIVARSGKTGLVFVDPETGNLLQSPPGLNGTISFAATGKSERSMIAYSPAGTLSYWSLESGEELRKLAVPANMKSPVLFSSNRFFAGIDRNGLVVLDALSGRELGRNNTIKDGQLIELQEDSQELACIQYQGGGNRFFLLQVNSSGRLETKSQKTIPGNTLRPECAFALGNSVLIGARDGTVKLYNQQSGSLKDMQTGRQFVINEIAASGKKIALLSANREIAFIPADFGDFSNDTVIHLEDAGTYNRISADSRSKDKESFILWQSGGTRYAPVLRNSGGMGGSIQGLSTRYSLRGCNIFGSLILFLDTSGNISIYNTESGKIAYRYTAAGALDAAFISEKNIIVARSSNSSANTPYLMLDIGTGETVPLAYPSEIGARVYLGQSGAIYAAALDHGSDDSKTTIISINTSNPAQSERLVEYMGEDTSFGIAECSGNLASTLGGDGASLFTKYDFRIFERSSGLPLKLLGTQSYFVALDESGNILWHNPASGEIEAALYMYERKWYLQKKNGEIIDGDIAPAKN